MENQFLDPGITIAIILSVALVCLFSLWVDKKNEI